MSVLTPSFCALETEQQRSSSLVLVQFCWGLRALWASEARGELKGASKESPADELGVGK